MREKTGTETGSSRPSPLVLVTDPSVEGATLVHALRIQGFRVLDVPVALLAGALAADRVSAIIVDVDQPGAVASIQAALARPESGSPRVFAIGRQETAREGGSTFESAVVFSRPIDVDGVAARVADLEPVDARFSLRGTTPPPSVAPRRETLRPDEERGSDHPGALDLEGPSLLGEMEDDESLLFDDESIWISPDLEAVLQQAAERARLSLSLVPSSAQSDVDVVLDASQVELLDEPLDGEDDDPRGNRTASGPLSSLPPLRPEAAYAAPAPPYPQMPRFADGLGAGEAPRAPPLGPAPGAAEPASRERPTGPPDAGPPNRSAEQRDPPPTLPPEAPSAKRTSFFPAPSLTRPDATLDLPTREGTPVSVGYRPEAGLVASAPHAPILAPPGHAFGGSPRPSAETFGFAGGVSPASPGYAPGGAPPVSSGPTTTTTPRPQQPQPQVLPEAYGEGEAPKVVAMALAARMSGCVTLESLEGGARVTRRLVLHEGDLVTAVSDAEGEAIVPFLAARGDLPRALVPALDRRIPPFGRLAGAALIAQGHLGQDDLWVVLRAHAEWVLTRMLASPTGGARHESPPGRLAQEPNVFGGAAGSEVFLENLRRAIDPTRALGWLGGREARLARGGRPELLVECALAPEEAELVRTLSGSRITDLVPGREVELAPLFFGLWTLGAVEVLAPPRREEPREEPGYDPLDDEAIRKRVEARVALAMEGDYFAVLGIPREATAYEIKRRYLELRRAFEPSRLLTAGTADLAADVTLVVEVLDEAYEVLREPYRRERYRRALEAGPPA